jgi:transaldolase
MQIFIDSADIQQIREAFSWGIVDGITTNPSLIKKAVEKLKATGDGVSMADYITRILEAADSTPVSLEVIGTTEREMTAQGLWLYERFNGVAGNVVVKVPVNPSTRAGDSLNWDGLKTIRTLADRGIPVNCTLIFTPEQALLAAKAGARYVSPFAGRIDDMLRARADFGGGKMDYFPAAGVASATGVHAHDNGLSSGVQLVSECVSIFARQGLECLVLAASLRNPRQVRECALAGAQVGTVPFEVLRAMIDHDKTVEGMVAFCKDIVPEYAELLPKA